MPISSMAFLKTFRAKVACSFVAVEMLLIGEAEASFSSKIVGVFEICQDIRKT